MTFADGVGTISNEGFIQVTFKAILSCVGIGNDEVFNIFQPTWRVIFIGMCVLVAGVAVFLALPLIFKSAYKKFINNNWLKKILIDSIAAIVIFAIVVAIFFGVIVGANNVSIDDDNLNVSLKALLVIAISIILAIFAITVVIYAVIKLYTGITANITVEVTEE
jgi:uncharacterized membrane protein YcfT